jgi:hypothetical protein
MNKKLMIGIVVILILAVAAFMTIKMLDNEVNESEVYTFIATVLENKGTSIMVQPIEGESELNSSDKIVVRVPKDSAILEDLSKFTVGSKVKITYNGEIMESYPAQINAIKVEVAE